MTRLLTSLTLLLTLAGTGCLNTETPTEPGSPNPVEYRYQRPCTPEISTDCRAGVSPFTCEFNNTLVFNVTKNQYECIPCGTAFTYTNGMSQVTLCSSTPVPTPTPTPTPHS